VPIRWLFLEGDPDQRATAIISLARLGDLRGAQLAYYALRRGEDPELELVLALGLTAHEPSELYLEKLAADVSRPEILRAAAMWAVGQIEMGRFGKAFNEQLSSGGSQADMVQPPRRCYSPMIEALGGDSQVLRCAAVQALGYSGPVEAAKPLIGFFERADYMDKCQSLSIVQHDVTRVEFVKFGLVRSQIIDALAKIGNRSIVSWLERQGDDRKNADEVILKARDLARQIRQL
jgi:HEAT repeat protein